MKNYLLEYSQDLAYSVETLCSLISNERNATSQILRSSSSVYANVREANYGQSNADMISKFEIALKEAYETEGWLDILRNKGYIAEEPFKRNRNLCGRIRRLLIASIRTLKAKQ